MGSESRFIFGRLGSLSLGFSVSRYPFLVTVTVQLLFWFVSIGFGRGYDEVQP